MTYQPPSNYPPAQPGGYGDGYGNQYDPNSPYGQGNQYDQGQYNQPAPYPGAYPTDFGAPPPPQGSKTPVVLLSILGVVLLLAIAGVTGFILLKDDSDDSGDDKSSSKTDDPSPTKKKKTDGPTSSPDDEDDLSDDVVGNSSTPYEFDVPTGFEEVTPPDSTYIESNTPDYEHAAAPKSASDPYDAIIVSAWGGQQSEDSVSDDDLVSLFDQVATNLGHSGGGENKMLDGHRARTYTKSDTINTFVLVDDTFIQVRCQFYQEEQEIRDGCSEVMSSIKFN